MQRRRFIAQLLGLPVVGYATVTLTACGDEHGSQASGLQAAGDSLQSFGYYQGLGPSETRSPSRSDGTNYDMPCISGADIAAGVDKEYLFWHGHGGGKHKFTVTAAHFKDLQENKPVELYTSIIDGHRHALRISPREVCRQTC